MNRHPAPRSLTSSPRTLVTQRRPVPRPALALLGIAQREIKASRIPDSSMVQFRKTSPKELQTIGDHLRHNRMEQGLTQRQIAAKLSIPRDRLQEFERDERIPSLADWQKLSEALGLTIPLNLKATIGGV